MLHTRVLAGSLIPLLFPHAAAQQGPLPDLQPHIVTSADGHCALAIDPSHRDGSGPGRYRFTRDGREVWAGEKPWTFWDSVVTDDGVVAGYSYSQGGLAQFAKGDFHAVILAPDGSVRLDETHERTPSSMMHSSPDPLGRGVFVQQDLGRVVFRISDSDRNRGCEEWWCFQLSDAKELFRKRPAELMKKQESRSSIVGARGVPGTALTIVEWSTLTWPQFGLTLTLHDAALAPVWELAQPGELAGSDDLASTRIRSEVFARGTLLDEVPPGHFAVGLPKSKQKVRFAVEVSGTEISVREVGRENWSLPDDTNHGPRFQDLPITKLAERARYPLAIGPVDPSPIRDIVAFDGAAGGAMRAVRQEKDRSVTLLRIAAKGGELGERHVLIPDLLPDLPVKLWSLGEVGWLATQSPYGEGAQSRAWRIDEETGTVTELGAFACPAVKSVSALAHGAFAVLATVHQKYTMTDTLRGCDADGRTLWTVDAKMDSEPSNLFSPESIATTTEGHIAVVDAIRHTLQLFASDGEFKATIDLEKAWGIKPRYTSRVSADVDGGVLVLDSGADPPLYRMRVDGTLRARLSPRFADGRAGEPLKWSALVAPDGNVWTTDGQRLSRLDEKGIVDLELGARVDADALAEPYAASFDVFGRALVQDKATAAVHVFDGHGKRLFVCRPDPGDFKNPNPLTHLAATRERGVVAQSGRTCIRFAPDGTRQGAVDLERGSTSLVLSPVSELAYAGRYREGFVELRSDLSVRAKFERAADGSWLEGADNPAIAPDGAVAIVDIPAPGRSMTRTALVLYEPPIASSARSFELPDRTPTYCLALGRGWAALAGYKNDALLVRRADGKRLRFRVTESDEKETWRFGFDPESGDLLVLDLGGHTLRHFGLP